MTNTPKIGDTITLKDLALGLFFPTYWAAYRQRCSKENVFKVKIINREENINEIVLMEVSPYEGRVILPNGVSAFVTDEQLGVAYRYTHRQEVEIYDDFE